MRLPRARLTVFLALLTVLAAGCGTTSGTPERAPAGTSPAKAAPVERSSTPPTSSTPPAPSPEAAADGTDLKSCRDSDCEVYVEGRTTIPLAKRFGFPEFVVTHARSGRTSVLGVDPVSGNLHAWVEGTGEVSANGITMKVISTNATGAVLRFEPRQD